ncbi:MAG: DUF5050 domain-containing protein [Candidatus Latescibacterota bacterium]
MRYIGALLLICGICDFAFSQGINAPKVAPEKPGRLIPTETVRATGVSLNKTSLYLFQGGASSRLTATVSPAGAVNKNVRWESSNPNVAAVDEMGKVTPESVGTCRILVYTEEGGYRASCDVMVEVMNTVGNNPGNIANGGYVANQGNWVYYANPYDGMKLYKIMLSGAGKTKLSDNTASNINVIGEWVYYTSPTLYKIRIDGSSETVLVDNMSAFSVIVVNDMIYCVYQNGMYTIDVNGRERRKLNDEKTIESFLPLGDWLYYLKVGVSVNDEQRGIYRIRKDGTGRTRLKDGGAVLFVPDGNIIHSLERISGAQHLYKMQLNGQNRTRIFNEQIFGMNAQNNWIYYIKDDYLGKIRTDGKLEEKLVYLREKFRHVHVFVVLDQIYYYPIRIGKESIDRLFSIRFDGVGNQEMK